MTNDEVYNDEIDNDKNIFSNGTGSRYGTAIYIAVVSAFAVKKTWLGK